MNTITSFLQDYVRQDTVSFHMPGHKGRRLFESLGMASALDNMTDADITELEGADNLFQAEGIIRATMDRYKELFHTRETFLLVGGSSAGNLAAILTAVPRGGKLIMASNCHKSAINGLTLAGARPVYVHPEIIAEHGITGEVTTYAINNAIRENPDASAVMITSPNYYGICSEIGDIARLCHEAGMILIVDQAHGAHMRLLADNGLPGGHMEAEGQGADIVINSIHKTLASFTQTAIANICSERIEPEMFEDRLQMVESSSPSYILMNSLDINAEIMEKHGRELAGSWISDLKWFYERARDIKGLSFVEHPRLDFTKINLDMSACGLDGRALMAELRRDGIYLELATAGITMAMSGIGNIRSDYERLLRGLYRVARENPPAPGEKPFFEMNAALFVHDGMINEIPAVRERVHYTEADGLICAASVIPYPPGIPIIAPGERCERPQLDYAYELRRRGAKVIGMDAHGYVIVGRE